jgi:hypothetical protein
VNPPTVKQRLTPKRRTRTVENDDFGAFVRRILKAYRRRIARGDIESLTGLWQLRAEVEHELQASVNGLYEHGYSWAEIGQRCDGMTKQAAWQRWGRPATTERPGNTR